MNLPIQEDLDKIVTNITELFPEAKVYLFGSYATGNQREDSDIDICVVNPQYKDRRMEVLYNIRVALRGATKKPIDILAFTTEEFNKRIKLKATLQYTILKEGVLLNG
jgi:predicted nucleotidyltransferase